MQQGLTDIQRTLLSSYIDGELSAIESGRAEELIASSPVARAYVEDLRKLNDLSTLAFPAIGTTVGAAAATKLTSSAIRAAAHKGGAQSILTSGWGMTGLAGAAVAVVVAGIMIISPSTDPPTMTTPADDPVAAAPASSSDRQQPAMKLDTSSLIVPVMTPAELVSFAVNGTLPLDENRERFITVADSATPAVHADLPSLLDRELRSLDPATFKRLDSIQDVVRTSLLSYSGDRIAIRNDIGALRVQVLRQIESHIAPRLPQETRRQLTVVCRSIEAEARELERHATIMEKQAGDLQKSAQEIEKGVQYVLLPQPSFPTALAGTPVAYVSPRQVRARNADYPRNVVVVQHTSLDNLRSQLPAMPATVTTASTFERPTSAGAGATAAAGVDRSYYNSSPAGSRRALIRTTAIGDTRNDNADQERMRNNDLQRQGSVRAPAFNNEGMRIDDRDLDRLLNGVQRSLDRADSILRRVEKQVELEEKQKEDTRPEMPPEWNMKSDGDVDEE